MKKIKIIGAGSIGNHLANAARNLGWDVVVCDIDPEALERMRFDIYPKRYGSWDDKIRLHSVKQAPTGGFDIIAVGTPPDVHLKLTMSAINEAPKVVLIEKPLCAPDMEGSGDLLNHASSHKVKLLVGYNHSVGKSVKLAIEKIRSGELGEAQTLDVEFREHWGGIFKAHPWLQGPADSYLGHWKSGGGASGEHSHAIHLWQTLAYAAGAGRVREVQAAVKYINGKGVYYDEVCLINLVTEKGLIGRVVQDVITSPPRKWARIQAVNGYVEWLCGNSAREDKYKSCIDDIEESKIIKKTRADDFIEELAHIEKIMESGEFGISPLEIKKGVETMEVIRAAHHSQATGKTVII